VHIAEKIAQIYGKTAEEIKNITTENAKRLFF
jgi:Tat protein secretion system quality control protein TatD with DNase activity